MLSRETASGWGSVVRRLTRAPPKSRGESVLVIKWARPTSPVTGVRKRGTQRKKVEGRQRQDTSSSDIFYFFLHISTFQLLDKPWSQVSFFLPPSSCLQFLSIADFSSSVANPKSICEPRQSPRIYIFEYALGMI